MIAARPTVQQLAVVTALQRNRGEISAETLRRLLAICRPRTA
jgi:Fe2+ or Zn2+ uptake regulation protein